MSRLSSSSSSSSLDSQQFRRIYQKQLEKQVKVPQRRIRQRDRSPPPSTINWHIYQTPKTSLILQNRIPRTILNLPIYRKEKDILQALINNQVFLITGDTGCGKSTQVPRIIYEYLEQSEKEGKILCVQPRRLAVLNLHSILSRQMTGEARVGYQIGMQHQIQGRILFMTNGIFLQRLIHDNTFLQEYPFLILDEVHQRDIDTDFILLTVKRVMRRYPRLRVILMSATIDNELFRYYFAEDHINNVLKEKNFYRRILDREEGSEEEADRYAAQEMLFMKSKKPCPVINVTEPGKYKRMYYYLDTIERYLTHSSSLKGTTTQFCEKYPTLHRELHEVVCLILKEITYRSSHKASVILIFLPGLGEIESLSDGLRSHFKEVFEQRYEILHVHSSILTEEITEKLHSGATDRTKLILATNIAESSITVMGVDHIIDFCLCKEVKFDLRSKMENLELVWASQASCEQRAGRTGRVCDGVVFRLVEETFYKKLPQYSTPEIQRSSLDKVILRIKLIHENETQGQIFEDSGQVLGSAIQPPHLKNIDSSINSLLFYGGLERRQEGDKCVFQLTHLGRLYVTFPIDIAYSKLLITSLLFDTYEDILILVAILSQSKNPFKRHLIEKSPQAYYEMMDSEYSCDFYSLVLCYWKREQHKQSVIPFDIYYETKQLVTELDKRVKANPYMNTLINLQRNTYQQQFKNKTQERFFWFQLTIVCGFIDKIIKIKNPTYDQKQEKRLKIMQMSQIQTKYTICLLNSPIIRKPQDSNAQRKLKEQWGANISRIFKIQPPSLTLTAGISYIHFAREREIRKFLFIKYSEEKKRREEEAKEAVLSVGQVLRCLGEIDYLGSGQFVTYEKGQSMHVDNYSINRVVDVSSKEEERCGVSNCISQQNGRLYVQYMSLLSHGDQVMYLAFYPFVQLRTDKNNTYYSDIKLKKKNNLSFGYHLEKEQIKQVNWIRRMLKLYYMGKEIDYNSFMRELMGYMMKKRRKMYREEKWEDVYFTEMKDKKKIPQQILQIIARKNNICEIKNKTQTNQFLNQIQQLPLTENYFLSQSIVGWSQQERKKHYIQWKKQKLQSIEQMQEEILNNDTYLICQFCHLKITRLQKVGPITRDNGRELFETQTKNIIQMPFNEVDSLFCSMLLMQNIQKRYIIYGCRNKHYFGIMMEGEKRIKIFPYSKLLIIYPNQTKNSYDFEKLDFRFWKNTSDRAINEKMKKQISTYCFLCDQTVRSMRDLVQHFKDQLHLLNYQDFKRCVNRIQMQQD